MNVDPKIVLINFFAIIISLTVHEYAHAWAANRMGDPTPGRYNRLNLNPITIMKAHPFGALVVPLIGSFNGFLIGWAATPVNPHLVDRRYSLRQAERWIALAGPLSNVILAVLSALIYSAIPTLLSGQSGTELGNELILLIEPIHLLARAMIFTNVFLAIFNMIPIPPFDGFTVMQSSLPAAFSDLSNLFRQYGNMILLFVFFFGGQVIAPLVYKLSFIFIQLSEGIFSTFR